MKPAPFLYARARTVDEALSLLAEHGEDAKPLAGGQSLVPLLNMRLARPSALVDLNRVEGLDRIAVESGAVRVGAIVRQSALEASVEARARLPLVAQALPFLGHFATRNRGTVGGSIAHADAAAELPVCLACLAGSVVAAGPAGRRELAADDFFLTHFTTALEPAELLVETVWPAARPGEGFAFEELALRHGDYALAMVACVVRGGRARVTLGSVCDRPTSLDLPLEPREAGETAAAAVDPSGSIHATPEYRRRLVATLVARAVERAARDAERRRG